MPAQLPQRWALFAIRAGPCTRSRLHAARLVLLVAAASATAIDMLRGGRRCCSRCSAALILSMLRGQLWRNEPSEWPRCFIWRALLATTLCVRARHRLARADRWILAVSAVSTSSGVQASALWTLTAPMHTRVPVSRVLGSAVDSLYVLLPYIGNCFNVRASASRVCSGLSCAQYQKTAFFAKV